MQKKYKSKLLRTSAVITLIAAFNLGLVSNAMCDTACNGSAYDMFGQDAGTFGTCVDDYAINSAADCIYSFYPLDGHRQLNFREPTMTRCGSQACSANGTTAHCVAGQKTRRTKK